MDLGVTALWCEDLRSSPFYSLHMFIFIKTFYRMFHIDKVRA